MAFNGDLPLLYDQSSGDTAPETPPLSTLIQRYVDEGAKQLRVAFPASIVAIEGDQTVDVQPLLQARYASQAPTTLKPIKTVPVLMPQGNDWRISFPLAVGDTGLVLVADRSLDNWLAGNGGVADPMDTRCHNLNDAIFVPGLVPQAKQTTDTGSDLVLQNGKTTLRLQKNGHFRVNNAAQELVDVLHQSTQTFVSTLQALQQMQILTAFGPAPVLASSIAQFAQLQTQLTQILANLDSFKS